MTHTIIIPHRNRVSHLKACLWSIRRSAEVTGRDDYEVLVVSDCGEFPRLATEPNVYHRITCRSSGETFSKPLALNHGIDNTGGDFITFLDADAIVGPRWLECVPFAEDITRVCYRVRYALSTELMKVPSLTEWPFREYDLFPLAWEAYGSPDESPVGSASGHGTTTKEFDPDGPWQLHPTRDNPLIFGNSQFTIRRDVLGGLRFDERFVGHGCEDLDMIWRIRLDVGTRYKGVIHTDADHAMFHLTHGYDPTWSNDEITRKNLEYYKGKREHYRNIMARIRMREGLSAERETEQ